MSYIRQHLADFLSIYVVTVFGIHFIVLKDAVSEFAPITFNAIRFMIGAVVMGAIAFRMRGRLYMAPRDRRYLFVATMIGLVGYQVLVVLALELTTSTNVSLMASTMPSWAALISVLSGRILPRTGLFFGLFTVLLGVAIVVLNNTDDGFSLQGPDIVGSGLALLGAFILGSFMVLTTGLIERYGGLTNAIYRHLFTAFGLGVLAMPDMVTLTLDDLPLELVPNFLFSGIVASLSGFFISNYAISKIGPTRFANYSNFQPVVTATAGILLLGEPLTVGLVVGGVLTLSGIMIVRRFTIDRPAQPHTAPEHPLPTIGAATAQPASSRL